MHLKIIQTIVINAHNHTWLGKQNKLAYKIKKKNHVNETTVFWCKFMSLGSILI